MASRGTFPSLDFPPVPDLVEFGYFSTAITFDHVVLQENIEKGQSVATHRVDIQVDSGWKPILESNTIGYKRIHRIDPVTTTGIRLIVPQHSGDVWISRFSLFHSAAS
jgi:alpha-L-fucosidase